MADLRDNLTNYLFWAIIIFIFIAGFLAIFIRMKFDSNEKTSYMKHAVVNTVIVSKVCDLISQHGFQLNEKERTSILLSVNMLSNDELENLKENLISIKSAFMLTRIIEYVQYKKSHKEDLNPIELYAIMKLVDKFF